MPVPRRHTETIASDREILLAIVFACPVTYYILSIILKNSQVPLLVSIFILCNMLSRTKVFTSLIEKAEPHLTKLLQVTDVLNLSSMLNDSIPPPTTTVNRSRFDSLLETSKVELLAAIKSLQSYSTNSKKNNERHKKLFKMMTWRQQKLCEDVGYLKRLDKIDTSISKNQVLLKDIATQAMETYQLSFRDFELLKSTNKNNNSSLNYRVIEALGHYIRDWCPEGESELQFLVDNVVTQLNESIAVEDRHKTMVVVPGSGLGRIAHAIAELGSSSSNDKFGSVQAVEYSGLMHVCNSYMYNNSTDKSDKAKSYELYPYIHTSSNITEAKSQFRSIKLNTGGQQPENLVLNHDDFRYFEAVDASKYENVVVVSVFFMDTAENIVEYFDAIETLTKPTSKNNIKNGYWINIGPLKYGSAAQAELTADELTKLRKSMGWRDVNCVTTIDKPKQYGENGLVGYITDKQSLWQGYYGLNIWNSKRKENKS